MCEYLKGVVGSSLPLPIHRTPPPFTWSKCDPQRGFKGVYEIIQPLSTPPPILPYLGYPLVVIFKMACIWCFLGFYMTSHFASGLQMAVSRLLINYPPLLTPPLIIPCLGWVTVSVTTHIQFKQRRRNINNNLYKIK